MATVEDLLSTLDPHIRAVAERTRQVVLDSMPGAVEQVDMGDRLFAYGTGQRMRDQVLAVVLHSGHVNLQFADGVDLADPQGLVEGTGKRIRHVKIRSLADAERPELRALVQQAVRLRGS